MRKTKQKSLAQPRKKTCQYCGKEFVVPNWRYGLAKYCSYACANKGRTTGRAYSKKRTCAKCGKEFLPTQWNQKYCSRACFFEVIRKRKKVKCLACGKEFTQTRVSSRYCSRSCAEPFSRGSKKFKKGYIDFLWGDLVKLLAGLKCEYCGKTTNLNSHHLFSRSRMNTRWDTDNGVCLCAGHHVLSNFSAHKSPIDFIEWLKEKRGEDWYNKLRAKSREPVKFTNADKVGIVQSLKQRIELLKMGNKPCAVSSKSFLEIAGT